MNGETVLADNAPNGDSLGASTSSRNSRSSGRPRPLSIIDDALLHSQTSPSTRFSTNGTSTRKRASVMFDSNGSNYLDVGERDDSTSRSPVSSNGKESPTRSRSRIPASSVDSARMLADGSASRSSRTNGGGGRELASSPAPLTPRSGSAAANRRSMMITGGTTKVLFDLQSGADKARQALESAKTQLRSSQKTIAELTKQSEDLREGRDRLRLENESLNAVVNRKERLFQELQERTATAESSSTELKASLAASQADTQAKVAGLSTDLSEKTVALQKSEQAYEALKGSVEGMVRDWQREAKVIRDEIQKKEEAWAAEQKAFAAKYEKLVGLQKSIAAERIALDKSRKDAAEMSSNLEDAFKEQIADLKAKVDVQLIQDTKSVNTVTEVAAELARIRTLMRGHAQVQSTAHSQPAPP